MVFDQQIPPFFDWFFSSLLVFLSVIAAVCVLGWLAGFLVSATRRGPVEGFYAVAKVIASAVSDLAHFSIRRTLAMALLAVQESIRRRVLVAFAVFVVVMLFAGWYLDVQSDDPARLYLSFVLTASTRLVLLLALVLSALSLPADIKNRTIYTIVTKPVRSVEIVFGRIFGFTAVGTLLLLAMCLMSYLFVVRGLDHEHEFEMDSLDRVASASEGTDPDTVVAKGQTTRDAHHRHTVTMYADGRGETSVEAGHRHRVERVGEGESATYRIGPPEGMLQARVPVLGNLSFRDRAGEPADSGVNVGHEWAYRSYIEGGTLAAAIWSFDNLDPSRYPDGLDLELNLRVFRTDKGEDIESGTPGSITIVNPDPSAEIPSSEPILFTAKEFVIDQRHIPRQLNALGPDGELREVDLFDDLSDNGRIQIWIRCLESRQYYGMARPDLYILDAQAPFWTNFIKGYVGIWLQMVLVSTFGVMFSTFLSGPVAMLATLSTIVIGLFRDFIVDLVRGAIQGGGPVEAFIRVVTQKNLTVKLDIGHYPTLVVQWMDNIFLWLLDLLVFALPNYEGFSLVSHVAYGYNIGATLMAMHLLKAFAYVLVVSIIGYFFLKTREMAA